MPLVRQHGPFSHPDWLFEIKHDGFRALAYIERGTARLLSRNGNWFKSFPVLCDSLVYAFDLAVPERARPMQTGADLNGRRDYARSFLRSPRGCCSATALRDVERNYSRQRVNATLRASSRSGSTASTRAGRRPPGSRSRIPPTAKSRGGASSSTRCGSGQRQRDNDLRLRLRPTVTHFGTELEPLLGVSVAQGVSFR